MRLINKFLVSHVIAITICAGPGFAQVPKTPGAAVPIRRAPRVKAPVIVPQRPQIDVLNVPQDPFDPDLRDALLLALDRSPAINAAKTEAQAAGVDVRAANWQRAPTISVQGNYFAVQGGEPSHTAPTVSVDLVLWNAGRTEAGVERASAGRKAAEARLVEAQLDVALQLVAQFHEYKRLTERIRIMDRDLNDMLSMQQSMQRRSEQGISPNSDLELAKTRTLQVRMMRDAVVAQRQAALRRLRELVIDPDFQASEKPLAGGFWLKANLDDLIDLSDAFDPHRRRLDAEAAMALADSRAASATRFPSVGVEYSYDDIYRHRVGLVVRAQATGLSEFVAARASSLRATAANQKVDTALHDLRAQVASDYIDYTSALSRLDVAEASSRSTDEVRDSYMRQFTAGKRTWLDVMNAVREAMSARLDSVDLKYQAALMQTRLLIRLGIMPTENTRQN